MVDLEMDEIMPTAYAMADQHDMSVGDALEIIYQNVKEDLAIALMVSMYQVEVERGELV